MVRNMRVASFVLSAAIAGCGSSGSGAPFSRADRRTTGTKSSWWGPSEPRYRIVYVLWPLPARRPCITSATPFQYRIRPNVSCASRGIRPSTVGLIWSETLSSTPLQS